MKQITDPKSLHEVLSAWRLQNKKIALVPTMGNLHEGHISLIKTAHTYCDQVVASIYVNPLQFGAQEDLGNYPRTLEEDCKKLAAAGCDVVFTPTDKVIYPHGMEAHTLVRIPRLSDVLCGKSRPIHFAGVTTIVCKLFNIVRPDMAFFGEKDYQQLLIIQRMVEDLYLDVEVRGCPIVRAENGLALSSRNSYLDDKQREQAINLYQALLKTRHVIHSGTSIKDAEAIGRAELETAGLRPDYLEVRTIPDLQPATGTEVSMRIFAAAFLGTTRLIDNIAV